jgi:hypothetical protein
VDALGVFGGSGGVGGVVLKDENSFKYEGIKYHAIARKTCQGCAFEFFDPCILTDEQAYCMAALRDDKQDVVWQQEPC